MLFSNFWNTQFYFYENITSIYSTFFDFLNFATELFYISFLFSVESNS